MKSYISKFKIIFIFSIIFFGVLFFVQASQAANHYIRAGATGANNGDDWSNAWTSWPTSFVRGDNYYIADGTYTGDETFNMPASGATWIYIKKATESEHGISTGWNSSYGDGTARFYNAKFTFTSPRWELDGVTGTGRSGYGFEYYYDIVNPTPIYPDAFIVHTDYITIKHWEIHWPDKEMYNGVGSVSVLYTYNGGSYSNYRHHIQKPHHMV